MGIDLKRSDNQPSLLLDAQAEKADLSTINNQQIERY